MTEKDKENFDMIFKIDSPFINSFGEFSIDEKGNPVLLEYPTGITVKSDFRDCNWPELEKDEHERR